jgi:hypothetical protein
VQELRERLKQSDLRKMGLRISQLASGLLLDGGAGYLTTGD